MNAISEAEKNLRESVKVFRRWAEVLDRPIPNMTRVEKTSTDKQINALRGMAARHEATANKLAELVSPEQ